MKTIMIASALAVALVSYAGAAEVQKTKASVATVKAQKMSDAEMDNLTARFSTHAAHRAATCCTFFDGRGREHTVNFHAWEHGFHGHLSP
jgi:hypothetical protein